MTKRLERSMDDKMLAGVCGGIGQYFGIDSTIIRLLWVALALSFGGGIIAYIIAWLIVPEEKLVEVVEENGV